MIKFLMTDKVTGDYVIGLGLTAENVERLKKGEPVFVPLASMGITDSKVASICITYGETLGDILAEIKPMITDNTEIYKQVRSPQGETNEVPGSVQRGDT